VTLTPARAEWNTAGSPGFTYCLAVVNCAPGEHMCTDSALGIATDCYAVCGAQPLGIGPGFCIGVTDAEAHTDWQILGGGNNESLGYFLLSAQGTLETPELFTISSTSNHDGGGDVEMELSVFRYAGDPSAFDGVQVLSVNELVDLGLIARDDILFVTDLPDGLQHLSFDVDVTGVPANEIVLFGVGREDFTGVPALGVWGGVALVLTLLGCSTAAARRVPTGGRT
jgi:hypothetical protein